MTNKRGDYADKWAHIQHEYLVHAAEQYIVFIDKDLDVDWETSREYDAIGHKDRGRHNAILNDAAFLESTPCDGLNRHVQLHFKRLVGEAIARSLDQDYTSAEKMLKAAREYISARSQETSRFWYLSSSSVMTLPFILAGSAFWVWRDVFSRLLGPGTFWLAMSMVAGSLGALLSVIGRSGKLHFDCSAGRRLHYLEGASRIWAGALSGLLVALAVRTELILAPLARGGKMIPAMMIAAFVAGAAERLATSIISTIGGAKVTAPESGGKLEEHVNG